MPDQTNFIDLKWFWNATKRIWTSYNPERKQHASDTARRFQKLQSRFRTKQLISWCFDSALRSIWMISPLRSLHERQADFEIAPRRLWGDGKRAGAMAPWCQDKLGTDPGMKKSRPRVKEHRIRRFQREPSVRAKHAPAQSRDGSLSRIATALENLVLLK